MSLEGWLPPFAARCRSSKEYQGDGWGVAWWTDEGWRRHRSLTPIWDDHAPDLPRARSFVVHARSAFRDSEVALRHAMPFLSEPLAFAFNGELRGVRLAVPGENGAARLFHLAQRFLAAEGGDAPAALRRLDEVVSRRSDYVRALNVLVADGRGVHALCRFSEDPEYFTLHRGRTSEGGASEGSAVVEALSSEPFAPVGVPVEWTTVGNGETVTLGAEGPPFIPLRAGTEPCSS